MNLKNKIHPRHFQLLTVCNFHGDSFSQEMNFKSLSQELKSLSQELKSLSQEMKSLSQEMKSLSQEMKSLSQILKLKISLADFEIENLSRRK